VSYCVNAEATSTLLGAQEGYVKLLCDASNPPTTERDRRGVKIAGVGATSGNVGSLKYLVPPGHFVLMQAVTVSGTPTLALVGPQYEQALA
jgi:hypothetical protein